MVNRKIMTNILVGLVVMLFAPVVLHSDQVHASAFDDFMSPEASERDSKEGEKTNHIDVLYGQAHPEDNYPAYDGSEKLRRSDYAVEQIKHYNKKYHQHMSYDSMIVNNDGAGMNPHAKNNVIISINQAQKINDIYNSNPREFSDISNIGNQQAKTDATYKIEKEAGVDINKQHDNYNQTNFINKFYHGKNKDIMNLYVQGMSPKNISRRLHVTLKKVEHALDNEL